MCFTLLPAIVVLIGDGGANDVPRSALELQLIGRWRGGPCLGTLTISADGTFRRSHYTPGDNRVSGIWKLRSDVAPPVLTLHGTESDDPALLQEDVVLKLVELNDAILRYHRADQDGDSTTIYRRLKE